MGRDADVLFSVYIIATESVRKQKLPFRELEHKRNILALFSYHVSNGPRSFEREIPLFKPTNYDVEANKEMKDSCVYSFYRLIRLGFHKNAGFN